MRLIVVLPTGNTKSLEISENDTIQELKKQLQSKFGLNMNNYSINNGTTCLDDKPEKYTLKVVSLTDGSMLHVVIKEPSESENTTVSSNISDFTSEIKQIGLNSITNILKNRTIDPDSISEYRNYIMNDTRDRLKVKYQDYCFYIITVIKSKQDGSSLSSNKSKFENDIALRVIYNEDKDWYIYSEIFAFNKKNRRNNRSTDSFDSHENKIKSICNNEMKKFLDKKSWDTHEMSRCSSLLLNNCMELLESELQNFSFGVYILIKSRHKSSSFGSAGWCQPEVDGCCCENFQTDTIYALMYVVGFHYK